MPCTSACVVLVASLTLWPSCHAQLRQRAGMGGGAENMNGEYLLTQTPGAKGPPAIPQQFKDYPGNVQSFDIYTTPITTLYSQVWYKALPPMPLPKHIRDAFDGKGMAIIGMEADQVRRTADGDVSVPISLVYNHHFVMSMIGKKARFEKVQFEGPNDPRLLHALSGMAHGLPSMKEHWMVFEDDEESMNSSASPRELHKSRRLSSHLNFDYGNGGEYRKSFHGQTPGFAQVIESPTEVQITPLMIDTWNREKMNLTYPTRFVPGPLPRSSTAPPDARHSGLVECPLTTRVEKDIDIAAVVQQELCEQPIMAAAECQRAAERVLQGSGVQLHPVRQGEDPQAPVGCSIRTSRSATGVPHMAEPFLNILSKSAPSCGEGAVQFAGAARSLIDVAVSIDLSKKEVLLSLTGPPRTREYDGLWFGVGFTDDAMQDEPWMIIVEGTAAGDTPVVSERAVGGNGLGELLAPSLTLVSSSVDTAGRRKVNLVRSLEGLTAKHFSFDPSRRPQLKIVNTVGNGHAFAQEHMAQASTTLVLLPVASEGVSAGSCICLVDPPFGRATGTVRYKRTNQSVDVGDSTPIRFVNKCPKFPKNDLLAQKNPTCDIRTYVGGQMACRHLWSLLDADQPIPWPDQPLTFQMKFRFWVHEHDESSITPVARVKWGLVTPVEYDVPRCGPGHESPYCHQARDGSWIHTNMGTDTLSGRLVSAGFHCHAGTCKSISLYRCPAGTKVCNATNGELLCRQEPLYGNDTAKRFAEPGYIVQPPCLWGGQQYGLEEPPLLTGSVLGWVKESDASTGHYGEMATLQGYVIPESSFKRLRLQSKVDQAEANGINTQRSEHRSPSFNV